MPKEVIMTSSDDVELRNFQLKIFLNEVRIYCNAELILTIKRKLDDKMSLVRHDITSSISEFFDLDNMNRIVVGHEDYEGDFVPDAVVETEDEEMEDAEDELDDEEE